MTDKIFKWHTEELWWNTHLQLNIANTALLHITQAVCSYFQADAEFVLTFVTDWSAPGCLHSYESQTSPYAMMSKADLGGVIIWLINCNWPFVLMVM